MSLMGQESFFFSNWSAVKPEDIDPVIRSIVEITEKTDGAAVIPPPH